MGEHERESQERTDAIAQLLRTAGRRVEPSQTLYEQTFAAASATLETVAWDTVASPATARVPCFRNSRRFVLRIVWR